MRPPLAVAALAFAVLAARPVSAGDFEALDARLLETLLPRIEQSVAAALEAQISAALERASAGRPAGLAKLAPPADAGTPAAHATMRAAAVASPNPQFVTRGERAEAAGGGRRRLARPRKGCGGSSHICGVGVKSD